VDDPDGLGGLGDCFQSVGGMLCAMAAGCLCPMFVPWTDGLGSLRRLRAAARWLRNSSQPCHPLCKQNDPWGHLHVLRAVTLSASKRCAGQLHMRLAHAPQQGFT